MALRSILPFQTGVVLSAALLVVGCGGGGSDGTLQSSPNPLAVDASFGESGTVRIALAPYNGEVSSVLEQADGKLLVAGYRKLGPVQSTDATHSVRPPSMVFVNRYLESGQLDASFGAGGAVGFSVRGADQSPLLRLVDGAGYYVSVDASKPCEQKFTGRYVQCFVGDVVEPNRVAWVHISDAGLVDTGAPEEGLAQTQLPPSLQNVQPNSITGQRTNLSDGRYLDLQNYASVGRIYGWSLKRHLANGDLDPSFGSDGVVNSRCGAADGRLLLDKGGNIWVVGLNIAWDVPESEQGLCIEKLSADGQKSATTPAPVKTYLGTDVSIDSVRFLDDGALMVAVSKSLASTQAMKALKYQPDGSLDTRYGVQGIADLSGVDGSQSLYLGLGILDGTGAIQGVSTGARSSANGTDRPNVWVRWKADASLDLRFGQGGILSLGDMPDFSQRKTALVDQKKRWILQTDSSQGVGVDVEGSVTLTRYAGESK